MFHGCHRGVPSSSGHHLFCIVIHERASAADEHQMSYSAIIDELLSETFPEKLKSDCEMKTPKCEHQFDNSQQTLLMLWLQRVTTLLHFINNMKQ
jgi:hypothetical protein